MQRTLEAVFGKVTVKLKNAVLGEYADGCFLFGRVIDDEFGVYRNFSTPEDRGRWLTAVRTAFEKNHVGWTMWDYQGGFGAVYKDGQAVRDDDVALQALGLKK